MQIYRKLFGYANIFSNFVENCLNGSCKFLVVELMEGAVRVAANGLQLHAGDDFGAIHCQPSTKFDRSTKLDLTTEPPLECSCC